MQQVRNHVGTARMALAVVAICASSARAAPEPVGAQVAVASVPASAREKDSASVVTLAGADFGQPADLGKLEQSRGGTDTTHNITNLDGVVSGNSATNVVTGNNVIDAGSFANMAGIPVVIQNSGANVLIQSSTIVNLQFK